MPLLTILIVLVIAGVALYLINKYVPMDRKFKIAINWIVFIVIAVWLLKVFGIWNDLKSVTF